MTMVYRFWNPLECFPGSSPAEAFEKAGARVFFDDDMDEYVVRDLPLEEALKIAKAWQLDYAP